jgi:hypothetical protein
MAVSDGGEGEPPKPEQARQIYKSSNGDEWLLIRTDSDVVVEHRPSEPSGGATSRMSLAAFFSGSKPHGPQHAELRRMIGTLVDAAAAGSETS